jgi:hypothetical protein
MCRSSSPLFGDPMFRQCSRDESERRVRQTGHFAREMGSGMIMSAGAEAQLVRDGRDKRAYQPPDVLGA